MIGSSKGILTGLVLVVLAIGSLLASPDVRAAETECATIPIVDDGLDRPGSAPLLAEVPGGAPLPGDPPGFGKRGRRRGPGRFHGRRRMPSAEQIGEGMAFLEEHWTERHTMMAQLQDDDPEAFELAFRNIWPQLSRLVELSHRNPELAGVEAKLIRLEYGILRTVRAYHKVTPDAASPGKPAQSDTPGPSTDGSAEVLKDLEALVGQRFDLQIKRSELRIQELADQLTQHRQRLETQRQNKQAEVTDVIRRLTSAKRSQKRPWSRWGGERPPRLRGVPGHEGPLGPGLGRGRGAGRSGITASAPTKPSD